MTEVNEIQTEARET